ncbi:hypothetical protein V1522DRAFT_424076 [Lipomyces starkeyi]
MAPKTRLEMIGIRGRVEDAVDEDTEESGDESLESSELSERSSTEIGTGSGELAALIMTESTKAQHREEGRMLL